jgi:hypothetical protein
VRDKNCGDSFYTVNIGDEYIENIKIMGDNYAAMLALWFLVAIVEIGYLVFKYFFEIKLAMEEEKLFYRKEAS